MKKSKLLTAITYLLLAGSIVYFSIHLREGQALTFTNLLAAFLGGSVTIFFYLGLKPIVEHFRKNTTGNKREYLNRMKKHIDKNLSS